MRSAILIALLPLTAAASDAPAAYKGIAVSDASGRYAMAINGRLQLRYTLHRPEDDDDGYSQRFATQRVRLNSPARRTPRSSATRCRSTPARAR